MNTAELLEAWPRTRMGRSTWLALLTRPDDAGSVVRACAATLAQPMTPARVIDEILVAGEFEAAALLIQDEQFARLADATSIAELEARIERVRAAVIEEVQGRLAPLSDRARRQNVGLDAVAIVRAAGQRSRVALAQLADVERQVESAEVATVRGLEGRLDAMPRPPAMSEQAFEEWRAGATQAIRLGALEAAAAIIDAGPTEDRAPVLDVPTPPVWPYRRETLARVVGWFFGEGVLPPGFERHVPDPSDTRAWELLGALRAFRWEEATEAERLQLLTAIAAILGCGIVRDDSGSAASCYLDDLSAPGFHAFGRRRRSRGVPVALPGTDQIMRLETAHDLVVQIDQGARAKGDRVLSLNVHDVLAVLHDRANRRGRLLAQLGRQLPLDRAFDALLVDDSVRWERADVPPGLASRERPTLLVGAPGMGKSTLLLELARGEPSAAVIDVATGLDLPAGECLLIDGVDHLPSDALRGLLRELHWIRTTRSPAPAIIVAVRPETQAAIEGIAPGMFGAFLLTPRAATALREQARAMLGWVGVEAAVPGSFDRMAYLAGGNPTVLFHLCRALAMTLASSGKARRVFEPVHLEAAWEDPGFRQAVRELLWTPLGKVEGCVEVMRVLVEFGDPGVPLSLDDLTWAVTETLGKGDAGWVDGRSRILGAYGLVRVQDRGFSLVSTGLGLLARGWIGGG